MSFIEKKNPVVLNIKITSKGRELLSEGNLNFKYFAVGDSEIDYAFNSVVNSGDTTAQLPYFSSILRAVDKNPTILSFITKNNDQTFLNPISSVPSTPSIIQNTAQPLGFFTIASGSTSFIIDSDHVKQPDTMVEIHRVSGGTTLQLYKSDTYRANLNDPSSGDLLLIKWTNPSGLTTTSGYGVDKNFPAPYLTYKIISVDPIQHSHNMPVPPIGDHSLIATVHVDRELPNFNGEGNGWVAGAIIFYNYSNYTGDTIYNYYATDYLNESVISFLENCQCPTIRFPFWNMSVIFTEEIAGVKLTDKKYSQFDSRIYGGFVSYIQNQSATIKKLGVIHYTNTSPSNTYAEELYLDTPTLYLPTIMWHKSLTKQMGLILRGYGGKKILLGEKKSLNTAYYDLADLNGNIVGKIFNDLKLFVIEDQELLFAMSNKSNRSWTLPNYIVATNTSAVFGCPDCNVTFDTAINSPIVQGTNTGSVMVYNINNTIGIAPDVELVLSVSGETHGKVYFNSITGNTLVSGLYSDTYYVILYDLRASTSTCVGKTVVVAEPSSILAIKELTSSESGLNPDFTINVNTTNPAIVTIPKSGIGTAFGTAKVGIKPFTQQTDPTVFTEFTGSPLGVQLTTMTLGNAYTIVVEDIVTTPTAVTFKASKDYVSIATPFKSTFSTSRGSDANGSYVWISDYLKTPLSNTTYKIIGTIEFMVTNVGSNPSNWVILPIGSTLGSAIKIYCGANDIRIKIRENYQTITAAEVVKTIDSTNTTITTTD